MEAWREELYHWGLKGMRWGHRRWQNPDGTFNEAGKERYFGRIKKGVAIGAGVAGVAGAAAGAAAYAKRHPETKEIAGRAFEQNIKLGKDKPNVSPAERIASKSGEMIGTAGRVYQKANEIQKKKSSGSRVTLYDDNLRIKSDADLKREINRMRDEVAWDDLNNKQIERGRVAAMDYIEMGKDVAVGIGAIATTAATIYALVHGKAG